ncbi:hypothetical protein GEV33_008836 [Tenebrio molitor]|uniref:Uncharacterized protein n=1 Tax=Tenebrio molitor TaxID=7067 RepID=A0A8J6H8D4_TENMO|nr:hypothetical protein GEV33_008836 [Tenebrio molitor]
MENVHHEMIKPGIYSSSFPLVETMNHPRYHDHLPSSGFAPPHPETTIFIITKIKRRRFNLAKRRVEVVFFIGRPSKGGAFMSEGDQTAQKRSERMAQLISRFSRPVQYLHPVETPVDPRPRRPPHAPLIRTNKTCKAASTPPNQPRFRREMCWNWSQLWLVDAEPHHYVCTRSRIELSTGPWYPGGAIYRGSGGHMGCVSGAAVAVEGRFITVQELKRKQVDGYSDRILIIKDGSGKFPSNAACTKYVIIPRPLIGGERPRRVAATVHGGISAGIPSIPGDPANCRPLNEPPPFGTRAAHVSARISNS